MMNAAFLFPGQGSQSVGMARDIYEEFSLVKEIFQMGEEITKINLSSLCFNGPMKELTETVNLQPAITVVNLSLLGIIEKENIAPALCAGHSLGEYSALCAAGVITREEAMRLVMRRGELMHRESLKNKGAMHAVVGLSMEALVGIVKRVREEEGAVSVANHNTEKQIVTTGAPEPVQKVSALSKEMGGRAIPLKVSGAWHSDLMKGAEGEFKDFLESFNFEKSQCPVIHNVTADSEDNPDEIKNLMASQLCSPVKWYDSMLAALDRGFDTFAEIGPGKVLTGLLKKTLPKGKNVALYQVNDLKGLDMFINECLKG